MIRSTNLSLGFALLFAASSMGSSAQSVPTDAAVTESVRRQADTISLRLKLAAAQQAEKRNDLPAAAKLYEDSWTLVQRIGDAGIDAEAQATSSGLCQIRLTLAQEAQKHNDYRAADVQVSRALKVNPKDAPAIEFKRANDKILAGLQGYMPSVDVLDRREGWQKEGITNSTKVQNAKLLFEYGKYDEAEVILKGVIAAEPANYAAAQYMSLIEEKRHANAVLAREVNSKKSIMQVEKEWEPSKSAGRLPIPNPMAQTDLIYTSQQRQAIVSKLARIRIDTMAYDGLPLSEVIRSLSDETRKRDPDKRGINFIIAPNADTTAAPISSAPAGVPFVPQILIDPATGLPVAAGAPAETVDLNSISVKLNPVFDITLQDALDIIVKVADRPIKYSVENYGVLITFRNAEKEPLHNRTFKVDPNTFWMGLVNVSSVSFGGSSSSGNGGNNNGGNNNNNGGNNNNNGGNNNNNGGNNNGGGGSSGSMMVPRVSVAGGGGGNNGGGNNNGGGGSGSIFGAGAGAGAGAARGAGGAAAAGAGGAAAAGGGGLDFITTQQSQSAVQAAVYTFFTGLGIDLVPPKAIFFNDREGRLFVRATLQDLDTIEEAVKLLNIAPPQVNIRAKFAEVGQSDKRALGFDWFFGNILMGNGGAVGVMAGTAPSYVGAPSAGNPAGFFPGTSSGSTIPPSASDQILTAGLRNTANAPALATVTGILTDPQFRVVVKALEQRDGVELLSAPDVTTLSGRQAQLQVVDVRTIVTGVNTGQSSNNGNNNNNNDNGNNGNNGSGGNSVGSSIDYQTQSLPFGPILDVVPYVSADGFTIQMVILPTITEFVGYDDPGAFVPKAQSVSATSVGLPLTAQLPLPHFRVRQVTTTAIVWDGQTVALGGLLSENVFKVKDKVPMLGDMPFIGRLFRSESNVTEKKNLVMFVTPTIIDPAGNRLHTDEQLPFTFQGSVLPTRPMVQPSTPPLSVR